MLSAVGIPPVADCFLHKRRFFGQIATEYNKILNFVLR